MKKKRIVVGLLSVVFTLMIVSTASAYTISYYVKDAYWEFYGNPLDHTYTCLSYPGGCYAIEDSTTSGGDLWGSYSITQGNSVHAFCVSSCGMEWGEDGTCHQDTNRMLYFAFASISSEVQGYTLSKFIYGLYGFGFVDCLDACGV